MSTPVSGGRKKREIEIDANDHARLLRVASIYEEISSLIVGHDAASFVEDRILSLAVMQLTKTLFVNVNRITQRTRRALDFVPWQDIDGIPAGLPRTQVDVGVSELWRILSGPLPAAIAELTSALHRTVPACKVHEENYTTPATIPRKASSYRILFKPNPRRLVGGVRFIPSSAWRLCSLTEPGMEAFRAQVETWFQNLSEKDRESMVRRLRSADESVHVAAFYELFFHQFFLRNSIPLIREPEFGILRPDFLVSHPASEFVLEITTAWDSTDVDDSRYDLDAVLTIIDKSCADFLLSVQFESFPSSQGADQLEREIKQWLNTIDGAVATKYFGSFDYGFRGTITARPRNRIISAGAVYEWNIARNDVSDTAMACDRIFGKDYAFSTMWNGCIVAAVCTRDNVPLDVSTIVQRLFGDHEIVSRGRGTRFIRIDANGRKLCPARNTRLSAVVFCTRRWDRCKMVYDMKVVHNPWAQHPLALSIFSNVPQLVPINSDEELWLDWTHADSGPFEFGPDKL